MEKLKRWLCRVLIILISCWKMSSGQYNDYSSFLSSNASLAVVVDHDYERQLNGNILEKFRKILSDTVRDKLKNGGLNIKYFNWRGIRLKKDYLAAMTVMDCENTWKFFETTRSSSVLLIAITDNNCPRLPHDEALMIPTVGNTEAFSQIILDAKVQNILKWKTAIVVMDETIVNQNTKLIQSVVQEGINYNIVPISLYLYSIDDHLKSQKKRHAISEALRPFRTNEKETHNFIVFSKFYEDIIEMAENMKMFHAKNQWLFFISETHLREFDAMTVTQNLNEGTNIAFVLNETMPSCETSFDCTVKEICTGFVLSISKLIAEEQSVYGEISDEEWEAVRLTKKEKQNEILRIMNDYLKNHTDCASCAKWRIDTALNWGKTQEHKKFYAADQNGANRNFEFINAGYWTPILGFVTDELAFPHVTHNFRNITLDILTIHNPPWQILKKDTRGNIIEHTGIVMEILKELSRMLNFTYALYDAHASDSTEQETLAQNDSNLLGSLTFNVPYQVVKLLQANKFFFAAVAATVDEPDKKHFNYTIPISVQQYSFISRKPDEVSRIYLFTAPFTLETWISLIGIILVTSPALYIINRFVPMKDLKVEAFCTVKNCFWYIYGALLQQGGMYLPQADSGRMVIGFWWIVVIVLVTTYCGNLVAFLTFPKYQPGLDYFFQLFKNTKYEQLGLRNGTFFEKYATISTRSEFQQYLERAIIYNNMKEENIEAVKEGSRVNIDWRINLQLIIQNHFEKDKECTFGLGKENFVDEQIALMMPSNSPYLNLINEKITHLWQMGFIERWHQTNLPSMDKCNGRQVLRQITNHKVNLDDMQGCFLVLLLGFLLAFVVILGEYWFHFWQLRHKDTSKEFFAN